MMRIASLILAGVVSLFSAGALADSLSYSYADVTYQATAAGSGDYIDGWKVKASQELGSNLFVQGSYAREDFNVVDRDDVRLGVGLRISAGENTDLYGVVSALREKINVSTVGWNDWHSWGYGVEGGIRTAISGNVELKLGAAGDRYTQNSGWETYGVVGTAIKLTDAFSLVADAKLTGGTGNQYNAGVRFSW